MLNEFKPNLLKKELNTDNLNFDGGFGGKDGGGNYTSEHPSFEDIMKFVAATSDEIILNPKHTLRMIVHFCQCEDCRKIKDEMMQMNDELELALLLTR